MTRYRPTVLASHISQSRVHHAKKVEFDSTRLDIGGIFSIGL